MTLGQRFTTDGLPSSTATAQPAGGGSTALTVQRPQQLGHHHRTTSINTVKHGITGLLRKCDAGDLMQLVLLAFPKGLIDLPRLSRQIFIVNGCSERA